MSGTRDITTCADIVIRKTFQNSPFHRLALFLLKKISQVPEPGCVLLENGICYCDSDFTVA